MRPRYCTRNPSNFDKALATLFHDGNDYMSSRLDICRWCQLAPLVLCKTNQLRHNHKCRLLHEPEWWDAESFSKVTCHIRSRLPKFHIFDGFPYLSIRDVRSIITQMSLLCLAASADRPRNCTKQLRVVLRSIHQLFASGGACNHSESMPQLGQNEQKRAPSGCCFKSHLRKQMVEGRSSLF